MKLKSNISNNMGVVLISLFPIILWAQSFNFVDDPRFNETQGMAMHLINNYPPETHMVVGLGRTTGVTGAWAQEISMSENYFQYSPVQELKSINKLSPEDQELVWSAILPSTEELGDRKLVLHRVLWAGQTAEETKASLVNYLKKRGYNLPITYDLMTATGSLWLSGDSDVKVKKNKMSYESNDAFIEDLNHTEKADGVKFIEFGDKKAATPEALLERGQFVKNAKRSSFKKAIGEGACMEALSHFQ